MGPWIHYDEPRTRDEIIAGLQAVHGQASELWQCFSEREFFERPTEGGWSPAQNVDHLVRSTTPVTMALRLPRILPRLLFGVARSPSRSFADVRAAYQAVLAAGGQAGRFGPRTVSSPRTTEAEPLLAGWRMLLTPLEAAIRRWDEASLDRVRLPHPLLGKLTAREMLFFTLYHLGHHAAIVAGRRAAKPTP